MFKKLMGKITEIWEDITSEELSFEEANGESKHIFVVGALGSGKSTVMSVLFDPTKAVTE